jgi:hypothetical protein
MKQRETRIRLSEKDHERLRIASAFAKKSMAEFTRYATLKLIEAFEAEYEARLAAHREPDEAH